MTPSIQAGIITAIIMAPWFLMALVLWRISRFGLPTDREGGE